ncbi:MAG TPA: hypothetical protein VFH77_18165 [Streptomyces sp.]|nr:hypothetical protein [Streptomyces sp.]
MGSLRNPIGPLPASIYWRRRAGALCILVLLAALAVWAVSLTGGGDGDSAGQGKGGGPVESITPGPSASESLPDDRPGGRDEVNGGGSGSAGGSAAGGTAGDGGSAAGSGSAGGSSGGDDEGSAGTGGTGGTGGSLTGGDGVPAGSGIPGCSSKDVEATLRSKENTYEPGDDPVLVLTLRNDSGSDCVVDLGGKGTVTTITGSDDEPVWASDDCPDGDAHAWVRVSAHDTSTHKIHWDRRRSSKECATPSAKHAPPGTYLAEVAVDGLPKTRTSFVLAKS